jgi:hypothetical protein
VARPPRPPGRSVTSGRKEVPFTARRGSASSVPDPACNHPLTWRGWTDFGSGALGDIAPHSMNVIFMALDLGAPSAVEVVETSGMRREMWPDWTHIRFDFAQARVHPPLSIHWYDGATPLPNSWGREGGPGCRLNLGRRCCGTGWGTWSGSARKGASRPVSDRFKARRPSRRCRRRRGDWGREDVQADWARAIKSGKQAPCHFGYAGPFTEAYSWGTSPCAWGTASNGIRWPSG